MLNVWSKLLEAHYCFFTEAPREDTESRGDKSRSFFEVLFNSGDSSVALCEIEF